MTAPVLESERLRLRGHTVEDLDDCASMWASEVVTRFIGGRPFSREEAWGKLQRNVGHWALLGFGLWVVCERLSGRFVGEVGMARFERELSPAGAAAADPELGWVLAPWSHGQGFASEAVRAVLAWGAGRFGPGQRVSCLVHPGNAASLRVAARCGFVERQRVDYHGEPGVILERRL
jgi:RimJ/RimL family protein N-acetyltransferase